MARKARGCDLVVILAVGDPGMAPEIIRKMTGIAMSPYLIRAVIEKVGPVICVQMAPGANLVSGDLPEA
jgi:hypothetical protein